MAGEQSDLSAQQTTGLGATKSDTTRPGRSFVEAAWEKFHGEMATDDCLGIYMPKKGPAKITDSGHLILPWRVHLTDCGISVAGRHSDMAGMCCNVTELDLTHNEITSLEEVLRVIRCMPELTFLNLTKNPLHASTVSMATAQNTQSSFHNIHGCCSDVTVNGTRCEVIPREDVVHSATAVRNVTVKNGNVVTEEVEVDGNRVSKATYNFAADFEEGKTVTLTTTTTITTTTTFKANKGASGSSNPKGECCYGQTVTSTSTTTTTVSTTTASTTPSSEALTSINVGPGNNHRAVKEAEDTQEKNTACENQNEKNAKDDRTENETSPPRTKRDSEEDTKNEKAASGPESVSKEPAERETEADQPSFCTVRQLVLNDTGIEWSGIAGLLRLFPNIEELHLSLNNYTSVDLPPDFVYPALTRLFFNGNRVGEWSRVNRLGLAFPSLQQLFLADTDISAIDDDEENLVQAFPRLELLSLNKSLLGSWEEIEHLRLFPALTDVRLVGVPFLEAQDIAERRLQLIARLPNVTKLNGSDVTAQERENAERAFLRLYMDTEDKPERYFDLEKVHGKLDPLANVNMSKYTVEVVMRDRREHLEISVEQSVRELKTFLADFAGLPATRFVVFYRDVKAEREPVKLKFPDKSLVSLRLSDGDEFIIEPRE